MGVDAVVNGRFVPLDHGFGPGIKVFVPFGFGPFVDAGEVDRGSVGAGNGCHDGGALGVFLTDYGALVKGLIWCIVLAAEADALAAFRDKASEGLLVLAKAQGQGYYQGDYPVLGFDQGYCRFGDQVVKVVAGRGAVTLVSHQMPAAVFALFFQPFLFIFAGVGRRLEVLVDAFVGRVADDNVKALPVGLVEQQPGVGPGRRSLRVQQGVLSEGGDFGAGHVLPDGFLECLSDGFIVLAQVGLGGLVMSRLPLFAEVDQLS